MITERILVASFINEAVYGINDMRTASLQSILLSQIYNSVFLLATMQNTFVNHLFSFTF